MLAGLLWTFFYSSLMDYNINYLIWKVLCWNIRGLNSDDKQLALFNKIVESGCAVACVQETKKERFDQNFIKNCCPRKFDNFVFSPSVGASGGSWSYGNPVSLLELLLNARVLVLLSLLSLHKVANLGP